jgi:predicted RNA-binding Zn-ribbon protein involved in translation (DUF1610 family)
MILTKEITVKVINHTLKHFIELGYEVEYGDIITIPIEHLNKGSNYRIRFKCDNCGKESEIKYNDYNRREHKKYLCPDCKQEAYKETCIEKYGVENTSSLKFIKDKRKKTIIERFGCDNVFQNEKIKEKSKETCMEKYGTEYAVQSMEIQKKSKNTRIRKNTQTPDDKLSELDIYYKEVRKVTYKNKKKLLKIWNGVDYYDNEYIKDNFSFDSGDNRYPTVDHKVCVFEGFCNKIDPKIIGNISNLCFTKRSNNSSKRIKTEEEYKNYMNK